jgi:hypothetical protein
MNRRRLAKFWIVPALLLAASSFAAAQERAGMSVYTSLNQNTATVGFLFQIRVEINFQDVDPDKIIAVKLSALNESDNASINHALNERRAGDWDGAGTRHGRFEVEFWVSFGKEIIPENKIQVDAYTLTKDRKSQHFLADYILKVKMIPRTTLKILSVDCPKPPDTVGVNESVPLRMTIQCVSMLPDSDIFGQIVAVSGGTGSWSWRSPKMSGSSRYVSQPFQVKFNQPGRWKLRAEAKTANFVAAPMEFEVEVANATMRVLGPVRVGYPKPPDSVRKGEKVRFDVSMDYKNFPAGTVAAVVFVDPSTGKDLSQAWASSRMISGNGTYDFEPLFLIAPAPGTWNLDVAFRLPRLDIPGEYETAYTKHISLQVQSQAAPTPPANPADMTAEITKIQKPAGTLKLNEIAPIFVTIRYDHFGEPGVTLRADVTEKGTTIFAGRGDSIVLRNQGTYTFPVINVKAAHAGAFNILVNIVGPNNRVLASKWTDFTVVN